MPFDSTSPISQNQTAEHLKRARQYLLDHGWCRDFARQGKRVCASAAIMDAVIVGKNMASAHIALISTSTMFVRAIGGNKIQNINIYVNSIAKWNDAPERTFEEVITAFDKAIELCLVEI